MENDVASAAATFSIPSMHDINCNEAAPCFMMRLIPGTQETDSLSLDFDYRSSDDDDEGKGEREWPAERWAPLGAAYSPTPSMLSLAEASVSEVDLQLHRLEEEQEQLNASLLALTSHFAQVQFRLRQIVSADPSDREVLLKELEDFAFRGIPDVRGCQARDAQLLEEVSTKEHEERMCAQRQKQKELITQLKCQLEDLETYAYESGHAEDPPTSRVIEKQKVVLEEVRSKLHIDLQNFDRLSTEELREIVNNAITSIVNPVKVKEKLIDQLKTQVVDLERFIQFLQGETDNPGPYGERRCTCPVHSKVSTYDSDAQSCCGSTKARGSYRGKGDNVGKQGKRGMEARASEMLRKVLTVLQIYIFSQLGCGGQDVNQNVLRKTPKGNDWKELREKLEGAITHTVEVALQQQQRDQQWHKDCCSQGELITTEAEELEFQSSAAVTLCVRKELAMAIRDLMQHGLVEQISANSGMVRFGCFSDRSADITRKMHAWDLLAKFYDMKHGREYKESPTHMLSQSFHLDMVGGKPVTAKQTLLGAIDTVLSSHHPHHHHFSKDSYFKAFICLALNERKLVTWLRLLFRTQMLVDKYYQDWSYVARTGFEDALQSLEKLLVVNFRLPVDLSFRGFSTIRDAF